MQLMIGKTQADCGHPSLTYHLQLPLVHSLSGVQLGSGVQWCLVIQDQHWCEGVRWARLGGQQGWKWGGVQQSLLEGW